MQSLTFDEHTHTYRHEGRVVPSVTRILRPLESFDMVPSELLERAAKFGTAVHKAIHLSLLGRLDWDSVDPALFPYIQAAQKWLVDTGATVLASEQRVYHEGKRYAGTIDVVADIRARLHSHRNVIDWKTSLVAPPTVGPQTWAYQQALKSMEGGKAPSRVCVLLRGDGTYRNLPQTDRGDGTIFQSCLNLLRWREAKGKS